MVKKINPQNLFSQDKTCYFESISGGSIKNIIMSLNENEKNLKKCKTFVITCGSNDLDSLYKGIQKVIELYLQLARLLKKLFPEGRFFFNNFPSLVSNCVSVMTPIISVSYL